MTDDDLANAIRVLSMDAVQRANSGHPGMPMGMAEVATVLFTRILKFDSSTPDWPDRDRFILSAGHGSMLLYSLAYLLGYEGMDMEQIKNFRQLHSKTAGHPEFGHAPAVETTTGPLGQGLGNAIGFAMGEAHLASIFGRELVDHYTYVICGDGCLMEGISQESISLAGHLKLHKLIVLWDDNGITIDGSVSIADSTDQLKRFEASGWDVRSVEGHDMDAIEAALLDAKQTPRPSLIACKTIIGKGAPQKAGTAKAHGAPLGDEEIARARQELDWPHTPFHIPPAILKRWRACGLRGRAERIAWEQRLTSSHHGNAFSSRLAGLDSDRLREITKACKEDLAQAPANIASRSASQNVLEALTPEMLSLFGGSADLTGSNNTRASCLSTFQAGDYSGRYVHYGVREHGMAAAMNGLALHGGILPYGGTFLVFSDYCRASIRLAALMGVHVIYVLSHDSIGLGEDGPTHQPVEHLAALRAIPNLNVYRPMDSVETAECWESALIENGRPSVLVLSRQTLPQLRKNYVSENLSDRGAYVLIDADDYQATVIATGSEVSIASELADNIREKGERPIRVVSMPSQERFERQSPIYIETVLGDRPRLVIEAGCRQGWEHWISERDAFVGMSGFGASAPKDDLYQHFGLTPSKAYERLQALVA